MVNGRGHRHDENLGRAQVGWVGAVTQLAGFSKLLRAAFQRVVLARLQFVDAGWVDVKTKGVAVFTKFNGEGEADVAQPDDGDGFVLEIHVLFFN